MSTTSSTSSSSSIASFYTTNGVTRLNGSQLISGLDTQSLITAMTMKTQSKIDKQGQMEQKAQWRQQMYQEIQSLLVAFNGNYFSYAGGANNIMSSKFFDSGALVSSSDLVTATGASSAAGNVVIKDVTSLAAAASLSTTYAPSATSITSGALRTEWTQSTLNGKSLTVSYGGNDYTLTLDSSASLDSSDPTGQNNLQSIADALNSQISASTSLNGKVQFSVTEPETGKYALTLSAIGSAPTTSVGIKANSADDTSADFLAAIGFNTIPATGDSGSLTGSPVQLDSSSVATSPLFSHTVSSSSYLTFALGEKTYTVTLGADIDLTASDAMAKLKDGLQTKIDQYADLKNANVQVAYDAGSNQFTVTGDSVFVTGGSENLLLGLGMQSEVGGAIETGTPGTVSTTKLAQSYLGDALAGSTLAVQLNGVSKTITFKSTEEASYSSIAGLRSYLQTAMNTAFGTDNVQVGPADDPTSNQLVFTTKDPTSIFTISSSSVSNVLSDNGALRISSGETNRLETTKTLNQLKGELNTALTPDTTESDGKYSISVNGKVFSFTGDTELGTVISTINSDPDAGVNIVYSQTLNRFTATADDTGSQGQVAITDAKGSSLATVLFGTADAQTFKKGSDLVMDAYLGGSSDATPVTRSTNSFTLDGVTLNIKGQPTGSVSFTASSNVDDLYSRISNFVDAYNAIIDKVNTYVTQAPYGLGSGNGSTESYDPLTDAQKKEMTADEITAWNEKAQQGLLQNDQTLSSILSDLREAMERTVSASGLTLGQIGISTAAYDYTSGGKLVIDETTLKSALQTKSDQVSQLFTDTNGIAANVKSVLNNYVGEYGNSGALYSIAGNKDFSTGSGSQLDSQIADYEETIKNLKAQLTTEQNFWQTKFSTMESKLSVLSSQYNYLSSMLGGSSQSS